MYTQGTPVYNDVNDAASLDLFLTHDRHRLRWWADKFQNLFDPENTQPFTSAQDAEMKVGICIMH